MRYFSGLSYAELKGMTTGEGALGFTQGRPFRPRRERPLQLIVRIIRLAVGVDLLRLDRDSYQKDVDHTHPDHLALVQAGSPS